MPIKPENRARYPRNWKAEIRPQILERDGHRCEGSPAYPDCRAANYQPHPATGSKVVLTIAHLDHVPENCDPANLRAWCQRCHNTYDQAHRRRKPLPGCADLHALAGGRTLQLKKSRRRDFSAQTCTHWREAAPMDSTSALAAGLEALHPRPLTQAELAALAWAHWYAEALRRIERPRAKP